MDLKVYSNSRCQYPIDIRNIQSGVLRFALFFTMLLFLSACALTEQAVRTGDRELPDPEIVKQAEENRLVSDSRPNASHTLTIEGYKLLCKKDFTGAIRILERAVGVNPSDGPGYYYLAEAWIGKKNYQLAFQFNRLASMYLRKSNKWADLTIAQKKRIKELQ